MQPGRSGIHGKQKFAATFPMAQVQNPRIPRRLMDFLHPGLGKGSQFVENCG
jgi:hypothetical protein